MSTSFWDIEYTDPDGKPKKARTQSVNGLHTEELLREHLDKHRQFGDGASITKITKLTDSAELAAAQASRPGDLPANIVKNIQAAENAGGVSPGGGQTAAQAFPPAADTPQPAPAQP